MADDAAVEYTFTCPACEERLLVNGAMRETLLENGWVICSTSRRPSTNSSRTCCRNSPNLFRSPLKNPPEY